MSILVGNSRTHSDAFDEEDDNQLDAHHMDKLVDSRKVKVDEMGKEVCHIITSVTTNLCATRLVEVTNIYQRNSSTWPLEKKQGYILELITGGPVCSVPIVIARKGSTDNIIDGGHRVNAIVAFYNGNFDIPIGDTSYYYENLTDKVKLAFRTRVLKFLSFERINRTTEVGIFMALNSGLPFSLGEKIHAHRSIIDFVALAEDITTDVNLFDQLSKILTAHLSGDNIRNSKILAGYMIAFNFWLKPRGGVFTELSYIDGFGESMVGMLLNMNQGGKFEAANDGLATKEERSVAIKEIGKRCEALSCVYSALSPAGKSQNRSTTRCTDFRRLLIAMILIAERPNAELDNFICFMTADESVGVPDKLRTKPGSSAHFNLQNVEILVTRFDSYVNGPPADA